MSSCRATNANAAIGRVLDIAGQMAACMRGAAWAAELRRGGRSVSEGDAIKAESLAASLKKAWALVQS